MSKIGDAILTGEELFVNALKEFNFWNEQLELYGYNEDNAVAAAQYYGQLCAYANYNMKIFGDEECKRIVDTLIPKFYRTQNIRNVLTKGS